MTNPVAKRIERHFTGGSDVWFIPSESATEAKLCKEAVDELNRLQKEADRLQQAIDSDLLDERTRLAAVLDEYKEVVDIAWPQIEKVRNAAKGMVTQIDKARGVIRAETDGNEI